MTDSSIEIWRYFPVEDLLAFDGVTTADTNSLRIMHCETIGDVVDMIEEVGGTGLNDKGHRSVCRALDRIIIPYELGENGKVR